MPPSNLASSAGAPTPIEPSANAVAANSAERLSALLVRAATAAAGGQQYPEGALYVVATPIGNLADLSLRAIAVLARMDAIACEDTRHTRVLLQHLGIARPLVALHAHNEQAAADAVLARLAIGERIACVSDAGTPAISDPGARLVARAHAAGHRVLPIPGPSAVAAAVSVAGLGARHWTFAGFLPAHGRERSVALRTLLAQPGALVLYESPQRVESLLRALADGVPRRRVTLGRELTKQFETVHRSLAVDLQAWWKDSAQPARGEFVVVVDSADSAAVDDGPAHLEPAAAGSAEASAAGIGSALGAAGPAASAETVLAVLQRNLPLRQAVDIATEVTGVARKRLYALAVARARAMDAEADAASGAVTGTDASTGEDGASSPAGQEHDPPQAG